MSRRRVLTFRATLRWPTPVWRDIEIKDDQTLVTLHKAIQRAFCWYDDHLYSFFLSGREWDSESEYTRPPTEEEQEFFDGDLFGKPPRSANIAQIRATVASQAPPIVRVNGTGKNQDSVLLEWSNTRILDLQ